jgi:hypothetical protein
MTWFGSPEFLAWAILVGTAEFMTAIAIRAYRWWQYRPLSHRRVHKLQAATGAWIGGAAVRTPNELPHPAPGDLEPLLGAGSISGPCGGPAKSPRLEVGSVGGPKHRAVGLLQQQGDVPTTARQGGGSAVPQSGVETPPPAPRQDTLGAGPIPGLLTVGRYQARTRAWAADGCPDSRATADTQTAHGVSDPGSATQTAATSLVADSCGGLGLQQPVTVGTPDSAVTGPQLPARAQLGWGTHPPGEGGEGGDATSRIQVASPRGTDRAHQTRSTT